MRYLSLFQIHSIQLIVFQFQHQIVLKNESFETMKNVILLNLNKILGLYNVQLVRCKQLETRVKFFLPIFLHQSIEFDVLITNSSFLVLINTFFWSKMAIYLEGPIFRKNDSFFELCRFLYFSFFNS